MLKKIILPIALFSILLTPFLLYSAQGTPIGSSACPPGVVCIPNPLRNSSGSLYDFIKDIINNVVLPVGGVIAVLFIIYSGFLFVTARGSEEKISEAKKAFMWAAIGTLVLLGAWVIAQAIEGTINQLMP